MKYWIRNTHNFNNETREWELKEQFRDDEEQFEEFKENSILGIRALELDEWLNLEEIVYNNEKYCYDSVNIVSNDSLQKCSKDVVLKDLEEMEKLGLVISKET